MSFKQQNRPSMRLIGSAPRTVAAVDIAPTTESAGFDCSSLSSVLISVHPAVPTLAAAPAGWIGQFRVWRFKVSAQDGASRPSGQWYAGENYDLHLDGTGIMEVALPTQLSEKMFFQLVASINGPAAYSLRLLALALGERGGDDEQPININNIVTNNDIAKDLLYSGNSLYSTAFTPFTATFVGAATLNIANAGFPLDITEQQIIAITRKVPGAETKMDIYRRGDGLDWDYDSATGNLTLDGIVLAATDLLEVYWEGTPRAHSIHGSAQQAMSGLSYLSQGGALARSSLPAAVANATAVTIIADEFGRLIDAAFTFATQSNRSEEIYPLNEKFLSESLVDTLALAAGTYYYPAATGDSMDNYKDLSLDIYLETAQGKTATLTLETTNDEDDSATGNWKNTSRQGYRPDLNTDDHASIISSGNTIQTEWDFDELNKRRFRWVLVIAGGAADVVILKQRRKAL